MKNFFLVLIISLLASCASHRTLTREEWLQIGQRNYTGIEKEKIINAAEKLLKLADGNDFQFSYTPDGFVASRRWLLYMVIAATVGTDYWTFEVKEVDKKLIANVRASSVAGNVNGYPTGGGQVSTVTTPSIGVPLQGTAMYDMFWNRLDYLLGLRNTWMDCDQGLDKIKSGETWGHLERICDSVTLNDDYPENLSESEIERIFKNNYSKKSEYLKKYRPELYEKIKNGHSENFHN